MDTTAIDVKREEKAIEKALAPISGFSIRSAVDLERAKGLLSTIHSEEKRVKELKESITKPLNESLRNIKSLFAPLEDKIEKAKDWVKGKMSDYNIKITEENRKKEAEVVAKVESGQMTAEQAGNKLEKLDQKTEAIPTRKVKEVVIKDESLIPRIYLMVDLVAVRRAVLGGVEVPGVEVVEKEIIVAR